LRANASRLGIDPNRIGAWGSSAGGELVSMLGVATRSAGFDVGENIDQSSSVQAVVDMFGPTDLNEMSDSSAFGRFFPEVVFGGDQAARRSASPINYVAIGDPPFLILHGSDDYFVRPHHSIDFANRLRVVGVPVQLVLVQHTAHSMDTPGQDPSPAEVETLVTDFFMRSLGTR
jgi:acetyl esterase/lipase